MAQIKFTVRNNNTGKVLYSCIKATGEFQELYDKLLQMANRIFDQHNINTFIYGYPYYYWWNCDDGFRKLLCAYGTPYFMYTDSSSYSYTYSILR